MGLKTDAWGAGTENCGCWATVRALGVSVHVRMPFGGGGGVSGGGGGGGGVVRWWWCGVVVVAVVSVRSQEMCECVYLG